LVEHADGHTYPVSKFDVIFILHGVKKQKNIIEYLAKNMAENARIVFRTVYDKNGELSNKSLNVSQLFEVKNSVDSPYLGSINSLLLLKKK